jgi:hypothetical protein
MLSLADPDVYRGTRHGYVRGGEPVRYVRRINGLGEMYYRLVPGADHEMERLGRRGRGPQPLASAPTGRSR